MAQRILIIDDSDAIHALVKARLKGENVEFLSALSGLAGVELATKSPPDLILLDVEMPAMDGFEVCRLLKSQSTTSDVPIIFLTGESSTEKKIRGLELGAVDYVTKPFDPAELRVRCRASLRTKYLIDLLAKKAMIDALTGLWNRRFFDQRLSALTSSAIRHHHPLTCVMIDVDRFKSVNDTYGHTFGDDVLRTVGGVLAEAARAEDVACRYGGEEFALLLPDTPAAGAMTVAERIRLTLERTILPYRTGPVSITASLGVAEYVPGETQSFIESADKALYRAKQSGRNRVELSSDERAG